MILQSGDKIAVVAPGAIFNKKKFNDGIKILKSWGLVPVFDKRIFKTDFIFAGTPEYRAEQIIKAFKDKNIKAIWCVRGGYGSYDVAEILNKKLKKIQPKFIIGLSDITALHLFLNKKFNLKTIHGPTLDRLCLAPQKELSMLKDVLFNKNFKLSLNQGLNKLNAVHKTVAAKLVGGNLSLCASSMGTSWELRSKNCILFLEDIGEPSYRLHRMISQLKQAGKFVGIKALLLGDFTDCKDKDSKERWKEVFLHHFKDAQFPIVFGVKSGHGALRLPLKLNAQFVLKITKHEIEFNEK